MLADSYNRKIEYLRLSVTDRCNLRCVYCLPDRYSKFSPAGEILSNQEIVSLVSSFADLGISKIRVTGGEPLIRPNFVELISRLSKISLITDLSLSTNGMLLKSMAKDLKKAGLQRVNISLDSLHDKTFKEITRTGNFQTTFEGIMAALEADLSPVKINVVVVRERNDHEIEELSRLTEEIPIHVRFIELMPMGESGFFSRERWVPVQEMMEKAGPLLPISRESWPVGFGPARYYKRKNGKGTVGFIAPLSCGFCSSCNRIRLSAKGVLFPCLDGINGINLKTPLRSSAGKEEIKNLIQDAVRNKPERHFMAERVHDVSESPRFMCQIGG